MTFEQVLDSCKAENRKPHRPAFRIEPVRDGWKIFDGDKSLAHVMPRAMDIWSFSPYEPDVMGNKTRESKTVDVHAVHNTWVNLGAGWPAHWRTLPPSALKWEWPKSSGTELEGVATLQGPNGEWGKWILRIKYDPTWGRYRYTWDIEARKVNVEGMELFNMLITHALADRAETRRWTHTVSPNADGQIMRLVNSNALYVAHGYCAVRNTTYPRTWVANVANPNFNPVTIVHSSNVPVYYAFCDQLFDQHVCWSNAGLDNLESDGYYHFRMSTEFASLIPAAATKLLETSREAFHARPHACGQGKYAVPFRMDAVNSFEEEADPWQPVDCPILVIEKNPAGNIVWDDSIGHTGKRSIRLKAESNAERRELFPMGAVCLARSHRNYKLEGWIRTKGVVNFARLELASIEYGYANIIGQSNSTMVSGDQQWTRVEAVLNSGEQAYVLPKMVLYGPGTAWFDDLSLTEIK